jgi:predicted DNA-binding antitoxin AbrB/MazE fold protein
MEPLLVEATYEGGVLKLDQPLPLGEHQRVQVSIVSTVSRARATAGMFGWKGDSKTLERIALDPEFGVEESP